MNLSFLQTVADNPLVGDALKVLLGFVAPITIALIARIYTWFRYRRVRLFWKWFIGQDVDIVMTEYADPNAPFASKAGGGYLVSRGNALAMSTLQQFLSTEITARHKVRVLGDKSAVPRSKYQVVIGSPANNDTSRGLFETLIHTFDLPWVVRSNPETDEIYFENTDETNKTQLRPFVKDKAGTDYAMVIRARITNPIDRYVIVIAGAYMYGTQAAADAVTERQVIDYVAKQCNGANDVMVLMKVGVAAELPHSPEIEFDGADHVYPLQRKQSTNPSHRAIVSPARTKGDTDTSQYQSPDAQ